MDAKATSVCIQRRVKSRKVPANKSLIRNLDMIQALGWNSLERTITDWTKLFAKVDPRLQFLGTRTPEDSSVSLVEAIFNP